MQTDGRQTADRPTDRYTDRQIDRQSDREPVLQTKMTLAQATRNYKWDLFPETSSCTFELPATPLHVRQQLLLLAATGIQGVDGAAGAG